MYKASNRRVGQEWPKIWSDSKVLSQELGINLVLPNYVSYGGTVSDNSVGRLGLMQDVPE